MPNRQYYILKFNSSWLREFNFNIHITFEQALKNKKVIALADNQMLRTIREITNHTVDMDKIEILFQQRDKIKLMDNNKENISKITKKLLSKGFNYDIIDLVFTIGDNYDLVIYFDIRHLPYRDPAFFRRLRHFSAHRTKKRQARREL